MLRSVPPGTTESRATSWLQRLNATGGPTYAAESLYAGDHWHVVRSLSGLAARNTVHSEAFVCSAGYGLISASAKIRPYSATFASSHPDSVVQAQSDGEVGLARRQWWSAISSWEGPKPGSSRSLAEAMRDFEYALIALSPPYLDAIADDLAHALTKVKPENLSIFSAGAKTSHRFAEYLIPCDSRLRGIVGGACSSLNIRCLRHAIERASEGLDRESVKRRFARLLEERPAVPPLERTPMTDEEVTSFILKALPQTLRKANAPPSHAPRRRQIVRAIPLLQTFPPGAGGSDG